MTAARVRGSQRIRSNSERGVDRLQGLVGVAEDWHTKMCFLVVRNWKCHNAYTTLHVHLFITNVGDMAAVV